MGFKLGRVYVLNFEGIEAMEGAVVKLRSPSIDTTEALPEMNASQTWEAMLAHVTEWNLETAKGEPLPITIEALHAEMEPAVANLIVKEWYKAARGVTAPLVPKSPAGEPSPEVEKPAPSMPMETL